MLTTVARMGRWLGRGVALVGGVTTAFLGRGVAQATDTTAANSVAANGWADRVEWFVHKAIGRVGDNIHDGLTGFFSVNDRFFLGWFATSFLVFGVIAFLRHRSAVPGTTFFRFLFPKGTYLHRSARIDYGVFLINRIFTPAVLITRLWGAAVIATAVSGLLVTAFGEHERFMPSGVATAIVFTLAIALVTDFGDWLSHALLHHVPVLWEFHKVHHSAEVMTPITVARVHPVEQITGSAVSTLCGGIAAGIAGYFLLQEPEPILFFGAQAVAFLFMASGSHLRHTNVWLSWGPVLDRVFISPAQHQIHHSTAPHHRNVNFGFIFALWDWIFGTIYVPRVRETLTFGLGGGVREHTTLWAAYVDPFKGAARVLGGRIVPPTRPMRDDAPAR